MRSEARVRRRALLGALGALGVLGCGRRVTGAAPAPAPARSGSARAASAVLLPAEERTWSFPTTPVGPMSVVVVVPERRPDQRFPVLVTLHGRGETLKGPERGARGWVDDYALGRAEQRLARPPLARGDFEGFVTPARLAALNTSLAAAPYQGLVVVCPYMPDVLSGDEPFTPALPLARFLVETLLPKIYGETPAIATPAATGIDGVSLGGRAALAVGLLRPEAFGALSSLQAAVDPENADEIAVRARRAREKNPTLRLRFVTSTEDYYLPALRRAHAALTRAGVRHEYFEALGPHDYAFNRGPGALEMLLFHDRALRGKDSI